MRYRIEKYGLVLLLALLFSACASQIPRAIREVPADSASLEQVRWGGTIIETGNRENVTWLTVLGRPLHKGGEPEITDDSAGHFITIVPEFLDPEVYAPLSAGHRDRHSAAHRG